MFTIVRRVGVLALVVALLGLIGLLPGGATEPAAVRLHIAADGKRFTFGSTTQTLTTSSSSCKLNSPEPLIDLSATYTSSYKTTSSGYPGIVGDAIGVRGDSTSNGTPCAQTSSTETLKLKPGTAIAGRTFIGLRLDLEMTGNAVVKLTLSKGTTSALYQLQTGTSIQSSQSSEPGYDTTVPYAVSSAPGDTTDACAAPNSSGPNSGPNDNCQWTVMPGFAFDTIVLTVTKGAVALEGSNDFGGNPAYDTLFYLTNTAPTVANDSVTTNEDTEATGNVLGNDSDAEGTALTATVVTGPTHGSLVLAPNGTFSYVPDADYNGPDSFQYAASDGIDSTTGTVAVTVLPVNDAPVAVNSEVTTDEDQTKTITIATDIDSPTISADCTVDGAGSYVDNGDGTVDFAPAADFNGTVVLQCTATDTSGASTTPSATISVGVAPTNDAPIAGDDSFEVPEAVSTSLDVLDNDSDIDGDPIVPTNIDAVTPVGSSVVVEMDGTVTFTPPFAYEGPASFTYQVDDGTTLSNVASVALNVYPTVCTNDTVTDTDLGVTGSFTLLADEFRCKRFTLESDADGQTVLFQVAGDALVNYRGEVQFDAEPAPPGGGPGTVTLLLRYDPTGGNDFRPVQWCIDPQFDVDDQVVGAILPAGENWCIASADTRPNVSGDLITRWEVYGRDDPKFTR
jgi:VCBS repeat-containing protein